MPRASKAQMESHRHDITSAASRLFRERGISSVSIADLMAAAGLTHGGFYGHFDSKDTLAASACEEAFSQSSKRWARRITGKTNPGEALKALVEPYLSVSSRDKPGTGCPAAALVNDVVREPTGAAVRAAYTNGLEKLVQVLASAQLTGVDETDRERALADLSTMVGALLLSRAVRESPISEEILEAARERLIPVDRTGTRSESDRRGRTSTDL